MARTKIILPEKFNFSTLLKVRIDDINYGGHLGNVSIAGFIHEARFQFFKAMGYKDEISVEGVGTIQADLQINYRSEAFHGDEIKIEVAVIETSRVSFDLVYRLTNSATAKEIALAKTTIVTFDYELNKKISVPAALVKTLESY